MAKYLDEYGNDVSGHVDDLRAQIVKLKKEVSLLKAKPAPKAVTKHK